MPCSNLLCKLCWHSMFQNFIKIKGGLQESKPNFFSNGHMLKEMNRTNVILIPKVKNPEEFSQIRLISCCNFTYKIFSKVPDNRLKPIIGN